MWLAGFIIPACSVAYAPAVFRREADFAKDCTLEFSSLLSHFHINNVRLDMTLIHSTSIPFHPNLHAPYPMFTPRL